MAAGELAWLVFSGIFLSSFSGGVCDDGYHIGGLVASAAVSVILLALVIAMIVAGLTWNNWFPQMQWAKGKVKMPRKYWQKKEEAKLRLLHGSRSGLASVAAPSESGLPNGHNTSRVRDTASWVQGWNNANPLGDAAYEEMALAMDLGEERDDEVRIETTVVDNEALDLGPFTSHADPRPATSAASEGTTMMGAAASVGAILASGTVTAASSSQPSEMMEDPQDSYVYSTVDRSTKKSAPAGRPDSMGGGDEEGPAATSEPVTSFSKLDPYLVAL